MLNIRDPYAAQNISDGRFLSVKQRSILCAAVFAVLTAIFLLTNEAALKGSSWSAADLNTLKHFLAAVEIAAALIVSVTMFLLGNNRMNQERLFLFLVLAYGLLYLFLITPLSPPDEEAHYAASYQLSNDMLRQEDTTLFNASDWNFTGFESHRNVASGYLRVLREFTSNDEENVPAQIDAFSVLNTVYYNGEYFPQALGICLGRVLGCNFVKTFLLGRFCNLLFYALCVYGSIKLLPDFKTTVGLVAILPISLQQAASYSYDAYINGLSFLLIAAILRSASLRTPFSFKEFLTVFVPAILLTPAKGAYFFLTFLFLLIPKSRFRSGGKVGYFLCMEIACLLFFLLAVPREILKPLFELDLSTNALERTNGFLPALWNSLAFLPTWAGQAMGATLSGLSLDLPVLLILPLPILILCSAIRTKESTVMVYGESRTAYLLISTAVFLVFLFVMFLTWTPISSDVIWGVQGRYFLPIIPLLVVSTRCKAIVLKTDPDRLLISVVAVISAFIVRYIAVWTIRC